MLTAIVACEYSATVRDALRAVGIDAWSNDILDTDGDPRWHIKGDCRDALRMRRWDMAILHVPCTGMGVCGNRHYAAGKPKHHIRVASVNLALEVWDIACEQAGSVALENPASIIFPILRKERGADVQYIHPWQHGHPEQKKTGLALRNLPRLTETDNVYDHMMTLPRKERERIHFMSPGPDRGHERSRFYTGFANAMAVQWGDYLRNLRREAA